MKNKFVDSVEVRSFGIDKYWAAHDGRIWSDYWNKWMKPGMGSNSGYAQINLTTESGPRRFSVHRLVAMAWLGEPPSDDHRVNHKNGNKHDNRVDNLEWVTHGENMRHAFRTGLNTLPCQKLNGAQVMIIRAAVAIGVPRKEIGEMFSITANSVSRIAYGGAWPHLPHLGNA